MTLLARLLATVALVGAAVVGISAAPAPAGAASVCTAGATVVVDFHSLGGGVQTACDPHGGGRTAATIFGDVGVKLTYVQRMAGAVCQVQDEPATPPGDCVSMPPANAYWSLWWSDGHTGSWTYASAGVGSQTVPAGGSVAFSWQGSAARAEPGVTPPITSAAPTTSSKPTQGKTKTSKAAGGGRVSAAPTPTATATPSATLSSTASPSPTASVAPQHARHRHLAPAVTPSASASSSPSSTPITPVTTSDASPTQHGGLPGWVPAVAVVVVLAAGGGIAVARRRRP